MTSPAPPPPPPPPSSSPRALNRERFELELEFVQALANPYYLQSLAQQGVLAQPEFIAYLKYLTYWKSAQYARFIQSAQHSAGLLVHVSSRRLRYPHALHHLDLLQTAAFRAQIAKDEWREHVNQKQFDHWRTWYAAPCLVSPTLALTCLR